MPCVTLGSNSVSVARRGESPGNTVYKQRTPGEPRNASVITLLSLLISEVALCYNHEAATQGRSGGDSIGSVSLVSNIITTC